MRGASKGEGWGNQFLVSHIREVDAVVHVVRCFDNENITHVDGAIDPLRENETIHVELALANQSSAEKHFKKIAKTKKIR